MTISEITELIRQDPANRHKTSLGINPLFTASPKAKIVIVGQAPGRIAESTRKPWNDASGVLLREWLALDDETFYGPLVSLMPMDFYFPGKGAHGDLPPRKDFAPKWHPKLLKAMPNVALVILVGSYAQKYYLGNRAKENLTQTVQNFHEYLPAFLPLVHPSPLNRRWLASHPWFLTDVIPEAKLLTQYALKK